MRDALAAKNGAPGVSFLSFLSPKSTVRTYVIEES